MKKDKCVNIEEAENTKLVRRKNYTEYYEQLPQKENMANVLLFKELHIIFLLSHMQNY